MSDLQQAGSGFVDVEGTQLYYEVAGTGEPVVLIHAGICDSRMWNEQWAVFALDHPEMIRSLVLVASGIGAAPPSEALQHIWESSSWATMTSRM